QFSKTFSHFPSSGVLYNSTTYKLRLSTDNLTFLGFICFVVLSVALLGVTFIILSYLKLKVNTFDNKITRSFSSCHNGLQKPSSDLEGLKFKEKKMIS
ncbi:MAG TPA: hypothetical protein PLP48_07450, partial [Acholeplasmataceae bacterium]|nr:hypothetical protein [Acholeplasmataceae bacterium]